MGIFLRGPVPIVRPEERVQHITIPGASGDLTETEGESIYNSYIQTVSMSVRDAWRVREVYQWLRGAGYVTFSGEPDRRQQARVIGAITLNRHSRNVDHWEGEAQFYCQPLKEKLREETQTITESRTNIRNSGDVIAKPLIRAVPDMSIMGITLGGKNLIVNGLTSGEAIWIDSRTCEIMNADRSVLLTKNSTGEFPQLMPGDNEILFAGASEIEIRKRERFL
jgi:phage-related protein